MKNWLFVLTLMSMVILYICTFLRKKLFENEINLQKLQVQLEGQSLFFKEENKKFKKITKELKRELMQKKEVISAENENEYPYEPEYKNIKPEKREVDNEEIEELENVYEEKLNESKEQKEEKIKEFAAPLKDIDDTIAENPGNVKDF